jgi:hypothetical protein
MCFKALIKTVNLNLIFIRFVSDEPIYPQINGWFYGTGSPYDYDVVYR